MISILYTLPYIGPWIVEHLGCEKCSAVVWLGLASTTFLVAATEQVLLVDFSFLLLYSQDT